MAKVTDEKLRATVDRWTHRYVTEPPFRKLMDIFFEILEEDPEHGGERVRRMIDESRARAGEAA